MAKRPQANSEERCQNSECERGTLIRDYSYAAYAPRVKQQISDMAINGSGIRAPARVLGMSPTTVIETRKTKPRFESGE